MTAPRFLPTPAPLDLDSLLALTGARLVRPAGRTLAITGVGALDWAGPSDIAWLDEGHAADALRRCQAGACILPPALAEGAPSRVVVLVSDDPERAFCRVAAALFPRLARPEPLFGPGVSAGASVHPEARLEVDVSVDPGAVVAPGAELGRGAVIGANAVIGPGVRVGRDSAIGPGCVVTNALIGDRVLVHAGASIGHSFGAKLATGRVIVQDGVEIGPNAAIARGWLGDTILGEHTLVDALVRIGAECLIGRHCVIFALASLDAGAVLGDFGTYGVTGAERSRPSPQARDSERSGVPQGRPSMTEEAPAAATPQDMAADTPNQLAAVDIMTIMKFLPHRYPFLLVDKIIEMRGDEYGVGVKNVTFNEPHFQGHFPNAPVMPGVLLIEGMAQTAGAMCVASRTVGPPQLVYFMTIDKAKFRKPVVPGDVVHYHLTRLKKRGSMWWYRGEAKVDGKVVCEAEVSAMLVDN